MEEIHGYDFVEKIGFENDENWWVYIATCFMKDGELLKYSSIKFEIYILIIMKSFIYYFCFLRKYKYYI